MEINQVATSIPKNDGLAIGITSFKKIFKELGYESKIYSMNNSYDGAKILNYKKLRENKNNILIYYYLFDNIMFDFVKSVKDKKVLYYCGITPLKYFEHFGNEHHKKHCYSGLKTLKELPKFIDIAIANSSYAAKDLIKAGFKDVHVLPQFIDLEKISNYKKINIERYKDNFINILFVGRFAPQKKQEDIIGVFYYYKKINPKSRLFLIGNYKIEIYYKALKELVNKLNLNDVHFIENVDYNKLANYYKIADVFICMSEWESFCIPLVEAMHFNIPVIAYSSSAIPETLGGGGILIKHKKLKEISELINKVITNKDIKEKIILNQNKRLKELSKEEIKKEIRALLRI